VHFCEIFVRLKLDLYKAFCDITPCRIVNTDVSEPVRGEMIIITLYLNFLQFLTDCSESKDRIVPSCVNIMKYDRL